MNTGNLPQLYSNRSIPFGNSWEKWIENWWTWCLSDPLNSSVAEDPTGESCSKNQTDLHVWFLAGTFGGKAERVCKIPSGRAIFFPVINDLISYAEYSGLKTEQELRAYAKDDLDTAIDYQVIADNIQLQGLEKYRIQSGLFKIVLPIETDSEITLNSTLAVSDGYWIFLKPLLAGTHSIFFKGKKRLYDAVQHSGYKGENGMFKVEVNYHITVI